jgi:PPOX class probable F420-dependent enzyme
VTADKLAELAKHKYIALETYRKSGQPVSTPVWFMIDNGLVYVVTRSTTGKVKRVRNNPAVRIVPSGYSGDPKGDWISGKARFVEGVEAERAVQLRKKKYGLQARLVGMLAYSKEQTTVIAIEIS